VSQRHDDFVRDRPRIGYGRSAAGARERGTDLLFHGHAAQKHDEPRNARFVEESVDRRKHGPLRF
jgi:hypothetical protein